MCAVPCAYPHMWGAGEDREWRGQKEERGRNREKRERGEEWEGRGAEKRGEGRQTDRQIPSSTRSGPVVTDKANTSQTEYPYPL